MNVYLLYYEGSLMEIFSTERAALYEIHLQDETALDDWEVIEMEVNHERS